MPRTENPFRLVFPILVLSLLAGCAGPSPLPTATPSPSAAPRLTQAILATATLSPEDLRAQRYQPILLTLDDFSEGIAYSDAQLRDNTAHAILSLATFSDAVGYSFENPGTDYLGGVTGFLDEDDLLVEFDAGIEGNLTNLLVSFAEGLADPGEPTFTPEEQALTTEIPPELMPADTYWLSDFVRTNDRLVRLDVVAFRRGNMGVYLLYVSSPTRDPLIDITAVTALLDQRIRSASSQ